jgi:hypothetical protein
MRLQVMCLLLLPSGFGQLQCVYSLGWMFVGWFVAFFMGR